MGKIVSDARLPKNGSPGKAAAALKALSMLESFVKRSPKLNAR